MADSMYDSDESEKPAAPEEHESKEQESGEETALLPKSFFAGKDIEPGSKCEVEVVHVYQDEVEVRYVKHDKKKDSDAKEDSEPSMKDKIAMAAT
jgi:hypothetical protein